MCRTMHMLLCVVYHTYECIIYYYNIHNMKEFYFHVTPAWYWNWKIVNFGIENEDWKHNPNIDRLHMIVCVCMYFIYERIRVCPLVVRWHFTADHARQAPILDLRWLPVYWTNSKYDSNVYVFFFFLFILIWKHC